MSATTPTKTAVVVLSDPSPGSDESLARRASEAVLELGNGLGVPLLASQQFGPGEMPEVVAVVPVDGLQPLQPFTWAARLAGGAAERRHVEARLAVTRSSRSR